VPRTASTYFIELKMTETVGDFFVEPLHQWGVRRIYGYPGDSINGVFGALQRAEGAAFESCFLHRASLLRT